MSNQLIVRDFTMLVKTSNGQLWHKDREGSQEALVLRYAACSLRCYVCYAQRYAYLNIDDKDVKSADVKQCLQSLRNLSERVAWIRILGGEPLINDERSIETVQMVAESLKYLSKNGTSDEPRVIIQTNGLWLAKTNLDQIKIFVNGLKNGLLAIDSGRIVIEMSMKGPNIGDANMYALSKVSNVTSTVFVHQLQAFKNLIEVVTEELWQHKIHSLAVYPVAGLGPYIDNPGFIPLSMIVSTEDEEYPIFHQETWSDSFSTLIKSFRMTMAKWNEVYGDYLLKHGHKIPIEGMSPSKFQFGWISQIKKRSELERFVSFNMRANWNSPSLNLFKKKYPFLQEMIRQADRTLLKRVSELSVDFYDAAPSFHYPFL
jgi:uncharacterized Fe-S cluster-containing radical SAM superfamily protein